MTPGIKGYDRPRALDLFCGAGGASLGLLAAGFEVTGVDVLLRSRDGRVRNPVIAHAIECDALSLKTSDLRGYDFVWASPPCQAYSPVRRLSPNAAPAPNLIPPTRALLEAAGVPAVIENVPGAPLRKDLVLTGPKVGEPTMIRKRYFEFIGMPAPPPVADVCARAADVVSLSGNSTPHAPRCAPGHRKFQQLPRAAQLAWKQRCIGAPWLTWHECNQAVPARYAYLIGRAALAFIGARGGRIAPLLSAAGGVFNRN